MRHGRGLAHGFDVLATVSGFDLQSVIQTGDHLPLHFQDFDALERSSGGLSLGFNGKFRDFAHLGVDFCRGISPSEGVSGSDPTLTSLPVADNFPRMVAIIQPPVYVLKITLEGSTPPVSRRVKVKSDISLDVLHEVIQCAMGWEHYHLHQFIVGKTFYGESNSGEDDYGMEMLDEQDVTLRDLAPKKRSKLKYEYDFGDGWMHLLKVEQVITDEPGFSGVECLGGENACPPEDVGGVWGYAELQETLKNPKHEEYEHYREWVGPDFDPVAFDLKKVNASLKRIKA